MNSSIYRNDNSLEKKNSIPLKNIDFSNKKDLESEKIELANYIESHIQPTINALRSQKSNLGNINKSTSKKVLKPNHDKYDNQPSEKMKKIDKIIRNLNIEYQNQIKDE